MPDQHPLPAADEDRVQRPAGRSPARRVVFTAVVVLVLALLFGVPAWTWFLAGNEWPTPIAAGGVALVVLALVTLPIAMVGGHARGSDAAARVGDTILGLVWISFVWTTLGLLARGVLALGGVEDPTRSRIVAVLSAVVVVAAALWGHVEAMRVPRLRRVSVDIAGLGSGLDGLRVVLVTDTHFGPIERSAWSRKVADAVNALDADIVCHVGDIADGSVAARLNQAAPLETVRARLAKVYVTGNHEYFGEAQAWLDHMETLGWDSLHNRHIVVSKGGDSLVVAGVDDATARASSASGHGAVLDAALAQADPSLPVFLLAHQPKQIGDAVRRGVDLQVSGHTHGGQIWPFEYLVRLDQPTVHGLSRHGSRTQLYTSRGSGFWGPPFRVFAPSEITVLTMKSVRGQHRTD